MKVNLRWITPETDQEIGYIARVSNPNAKPTDPITRLIRYLLKHKHVSPFEMACMCVEIITTRDIARQILRHKSFHFQEFSQRYSEVPEEPEFVDQARLQDTENRQNSIPTDDFWLNSEWIWLQNKVWDFCWLAYKTALRLGVAKELARKLLPEGLTPSRMFMQGTIRDWLFYIDIRIGPETQLEHRQVAQEISKVLREHAPKTWQAAKEAGLRLE